jgi:hypothetical protein
MFPAYADDATQDEDYVRNEYSHNKSEDVGEDGEASPF